MRFPRNNPCKVQSKYYVNKYLPTKYYFFEFFSYSKIIVASVVVKEQKLGESIYIILHIFFVIVTKI